MSERTIKRAFISVYDKTGIVEFARALVDEFGMEIISTGGTAGFLKDHAIPVTLVEEVTGFPELLDGRVKTLHPKIHAAILADRDNPGHMRQLAEQGIEPIDMVVVNLYPFAETVKRADCTFEEAIEMIDIGGPCLLRAAAKNHKHVIAIVVERSFQFVLDALREEGDLAETGRACLARIAFEMTAAYDTAVEDYLNRRGYELRDKGSADLRRHFTPEDDRHVPSAPLGEGGTLVLDPVRPLRYGENPHQLATLASLLDQAQTEPTVVNGGMASDSAEMSYNNYGDAHSALELCKDLTRAAGSCVGPTFQSVGPCHVGPTFESVDPCHAGPTFESVGGAGEPAPQSGQSSGTSHPVTDEQHTRRHLPHIQVPQRHYYVTFRLKAGSLTPEERTVVLDACKYWHQKKMTLHACVVMPDHVHLIITPHESAPGAWVPLGDLLRSVKGFSARRINQMRGTRGSLWMDESWDRIIRNEKEYFERLNYIANNAPKAGLGRDYQWLWINEHPWHDLEAYDRLESRSHTKIDNDPPVRGGETESDDDRLESRFHRRSSHDRRRPELQSESKHDRLESRFHTPTTESEELDEPATQAAHAATPGTFESAPGHAACAFIKHTNPCGVGIAEDPLEAYRRSYLGDPNAAMGGVFACNFDVTPEFAMAVMETYTRWGKPAGAGGFFVEVWIAPRFAKDAVQAIRTGRKWGERVRLLEVGDMTTPPDARAMEYRSITGGMLVQSRDLVGLNQGQWKVVTKRSPTDAELSDMRLAWLIAKHTKSNAISLCKAGMLIGNGAGQMSRVMSCRIATWLAKENGHEGKLNGAVAASDAFFPFRDGPDILMDAGVTALIQPGGSKRDEDTIKACDERDVAMIFTGTRHFMH